MLRDKIYSVNFKHLSRGKSFTSCLIRRQKSLLNTCIKDGNWEWKIKCTSWEEWELRTLIYSANSLKQSLKILTSSIPLTVLYILLRILFIEYRHKNNFNFFLTNNYFFSSVEIGFADLRRKTEIFLLFSGYKTSLKLSNKRSVIFK